MTPAVAFRPLRRDDVPLLEAQARHDAAGTRRLGMSPARWWSLVDGDPRRHGWIVLSDGEASGYVDAEEDGGTVFLAMMLFPAARGRDRASAVLQAALTLPPMLAADEVRAYVEVDNEPARRLLRRVGFVENGLDDDGLVIYRSSTPAR